MYKWHLQSALRSSRPVANDLKIVTDGIAASLRQFSVSAQRAEEEKPRFTISRQYVGGSGDAPRPSRSARTAAATDALTSLRPRPQQSSASGPRRGVDARALAARPPPSQNGIRSPRQFTPRGRGGVASRGRGGRGGAARGRGGRGGAREGRPRGPRERKDEFQEELHEPNTKEEQAYEDAMNFGVLAEAHAAQLSRSQLEEKAVAVAWSSSELGVDKAYKGVAKVYAERTENEVIAKDPSFHLYKHRETLEFHPGHEKTMEFAAVSKILVAPFKGAYPDITQPAKKGDFAGAVKVNTTRNPLYMRTDIEKITEEFVKRVPKAKAAAPAGKGKAAPKKATLKN